MRTPFDSAVELDDLLEETRGSCPEVWAGRERCRSRGRTPFRQRIKTSENLVLMEPRPIGPLIPFRAGLAILVPAKEQPALARFRLTAAAGMDEREQSWRRPAAAGRRRLVFVRTSSEPAAVPSLCSS